jgi:hypothetical protein
MAGWAKMATLAGKSQQIFVTAVITFDTGKAIVRIATVEIAIDHLLNIWPPESVLPGEMLVINPDKGFKIVLYTCGSNPKTADYVDDKQRQEATRFLSSENIMPP